MGGTEVKFENVDFRGFTQRDNERKRTCGVCVYNLFIMPLGPQSVSGL